MAAETVRLLEVCWLVVVEDVALPVVGGCAAGPLVPEREQCEDDIKKNIKKEYFDFLHLLNASKRLKK